MRDYTLAIQKLNSLQTNASIIDALRKTGNILNTQSIPEMVAFLKRIGYEPADLDKLNIIHIAGTKVITIKTWGKVALVLFVNQSLTAFA
jgi:folylpolyglutamate synthase